jgi:hypothetical protein
LPEITNPQSSGAGDSLQQAVEDGLREHRPKSAEHWNLLTDLTVEQLDHVAL